MAKQTISIGTSPNDGTGDALRTAFQKSNSNFTELYNLVELNQYSLPVATGSTLGGVRIGNNISVFNGTISVASQVQPDWNATTGLGNILNKPADNVLLNGIHTVSLSSQGILETPSDIKLYDQKQITSINANVNNGLGGVGKVGWFNHPDENYADGANVKVWGLYTEGEIVIRTSNGINSTPYWHFSKTGNFVLPENGNIVKKDGTSYLNYNNLINKPGGVVSVVPTTPQGVAGDKAGDIAFSETHMYICSQAYNGTSSIWKRVLLDTSVWGT